MAREWADYDEEMAALNRLSDEFEAMEAERIALFRTMGADHFPGKDHVPSFYSLAVKLPENERRELSAMYRSLKLETLKIRAANSSFLQYLNEAKTMTAAFLEAAFPDRYGRLYSRKGTQVMSQQPRNMMLNHQI